MTGNASSSWRAREETITQLLQGSTVSTQRDILEQILLHYPKRIARWIAQHCPERLLPNKESAGVLDALEGWGKEPPMGGSWTQWPNSPYWSSVPIISHRPTAQRKPINLKSITHAHGNNDNNPSK